MHFRYSNLVNVAFVTMMYGTVMPILYPIALLSYLIVYFCRITMLFYVNKKPLDYDGTLNKLTLNKLKLASLVSLGANYWQLLNPRFFGLKHGSDVHPDYKIQYLNPVFVFNNFRVAFPVMIMFYTLLIYLTFSRKIMDLRNKFWGQSETINSQDLKPYFESLQEHDLRQMIDEEDYNRTQFNYKCMDISTLEYLEDRQLDRSSYSSNWSEQEGSKL